MWGRPLLLPLRTPRRSRAEPMRIRRTIRLRAFPRITLGISVSATAAESGVITASVSGGGDGNLANNMSSVKFSITASPDLTITLAHAGTFAQGNVANYQITVRNIGAAKTNGV